MSGGMRETESFGAACLLKMESSGMVGGTNLSVVVLG